MKILRNPAGVFFRYIKSQIYDIHEILQEFRDDMLLARYTVGWEADPLKASFFFVFALMRATIRLRRLGIVFAVADMINALLSQDKIEFLNSVFELIAEFIPEPFATSLSFAGAIICGLL